MRNVLKVVQSESRQGVTYDICRGHNGHVYCTCPAWKFSKDENGHKSCKHLRAFLNSRPATRRQQYRLGFAEKIAKELKVDPAHPGTKSLAHAIEKY